MPSTLLSSATTLLFTALTTAFTTPLSPCRLVHILIARDTTETYPGTLSSLAALITASNPNTTYENINYPATQETITDSCAIGRRASREQLTAYVEKFPEGKVVVLAYSQGVLDMADAIAGGGGSGEVLFHGANYTAALSSKIGYHISAPVFYGNPRHMPFQVYNIYDSNVIGKYPRTEPQLATLLGFADRIHDYCNLGDPVCASGTNLTAHLVYPKLWDTKAAAFGQSR